MLSPSSVNISILSFTCEDIDVAIVTVILALNVLLIFRFQKHCYRNKLNIVMLVKYFNTIHSGLKRAVLVMDVSYPFLSITFEII